MSFSACNLFPLTMVRRRREVLSCDALLLQFSCRDGDFRSRVRAQTLVKWGTGAESTRAVDYHPLDEPQPRDNGRLTQSVSFVFAWGGQAFHKVALWWFGKFRPHPRLCIPCSFCSQFPPFPRLMVFPSPTDLFPWWSFCTVNPLLVYSSRCPPSPQD